MLRDADESEPEYDCPTCGRSFSTFARLDDHMAEHQGPRRCNACGETIHSPYHRCR
jgi:DNA-directed RNA polymerase subunit RPC12/RpoP